MSDRPESASGTLIREPSDPPIIDQWGDMWWLSQSGQVVCDNHVDATTNGVQELGYFNRSVWQWVPTKRLWWYKTSRTAPWLPTGGTPNAPFGPTPDPRIDILQSTLDAVLAELMRVDVARTIELQQMQVAINQIPTSAVPDPRIDALMGLLRQFVIAAGGLLGDLSTKVDASADAIDMALAAISTTLAAVLTAASDSSKEDAMAAQLARIIQMLLDLFPKPATAIKAAPLREGTAEGTQTAPIPTGP